MQCNFLRNQTERKRKKKKKKRKKRTMRTFRRSRVSEAMRPLLGRPNRISVRSGTRASSTGPFTSATWDCCDGAQHSKTVRLKGNEGVEAERHGWSKYMREMICRFSRKIYEKEDLLKLMFGLHLLLYIFFLF